jgi:hypothetical protein
MNDIVGPPSWVVLSIAVLRLIGCHNFIVDILNSPRWRQLTFIYAKVVQAGAAHYNLADIHKLESERGAQQYPLFSHQ